MSKPSTPVFTSIPDGSQQARIQAARQHGARAILGPDDETGLLAALNEQQRRQRLREGRPEDITASFREHDILEPQARPNYDVIPTEHVKVTLPQLQSWYVASFAPRLAERVRRGLDEIGWDWYCPMLKEWQPVARPKKGEAKKVAVEKPLFGSYAFPSPRPGTPFDGVALERIDGLGHFVRAEGKHSAPTIVSLGEVEKWKRWESDGMFDGTRTRPPKVKRGDSVYFTSGPFEGWKALVEMATEDRVKVLMGMLGVVEVPMSQIEVAG